MVTGKGPLARNGLPLDAKKPADRFRSPAKGSGDQAAATDELAARAVAAMLRRLDSMPRLYVAPAPPPTGLPAGARPLPGASELPAGGGPGTDPPGGVAVPGQPPSDGARARAGRSSARLASAGLGSAGVRLGRESRKTFFQAEKTCRGNEPAV